MRIERFRTQDRLLGVTRMDGQRAQALDTGNTFEYVTGSGWVQDVPVNGVAGAPIVIAEITPAGQRVIGVGERRQLVPDGVAGQVVTYDDQDYPAADEVDVGAGLEVSDVTMPVDFSSGSDTIICSRVIPGGALGANGFVTVKAVARVITNASRTATFSLFSNSIILDSRSMSSSPNEWWIEVESTMFNTNDEGSQRAAGSVKAALHTLGSQTSSNFDENFFGVSFLATDTSIDWVLDARVQASGAITGSADVYGVSIQYGYVA